jgi:hypothetical protein
LVRLIWHAKPQKLFSIRIWQWTDIDIDIQCILHCMIYILHWLIFIDFFNPVCTRRNFSWWSWYLNLLNTRLRRLRVNIHWFNYRLIDNRQCLFEDAQQSVLLKWVLFVLIKWITWWIFVSSVIWCFHNRFLINTQFQFKIFKIRLICNWTSV